MVGLAALVVAALAVDPRDEAGEVAVQTGPTPAELSPLATRPEAGGSTWFCAGGTATPGGDADHSLVLFNPNDREAAGNVQVFPEGGPPVASPVRLAAHGRAVVVLNQIVQAPYAAALVELDAGGVVVEQEVRASAAGTRPGAPPSPRPSGTSPGGAPPWAPACAWRC